MGAGARKKFTDVTLINPALSTFKDRTGPAKFFLVEADPKNVPESTENLKQLLPTAETKIIQAFVAKDCESTALFATIDEKIQRDFAIPFFPRKAHTKFTKLLEILAFDKENFLEHNNWKIGEKLCLSPDATCFTVSADLGRRAEAFAGLPWEKMAAYVRKVKPNCLTPDELLPTMGVAAEDVAMLVLDCEGCEPDILRTLFNSTSFRPQFVQYEDKGAYLHNADGPADDKFALWMLGKQLNYNVGVASRTNDDPFNIIAVRKAPASSTETSAGRPEGVPSLRAATGRSGNSRRRRYF